MGSLSDTIAAVSTAQAPAGIGIVRISGPKAFEIADRLYSGKNGKKLAGQKGNTIHYGWIRDGEKEIDEALDEACKAVGVIVSKGPDAAMNEYNRKKTV